MWSPLCSCTTGCRGVGRTHATGADSTTREGATPPVHCGSSPASFVGRPAASLRFAGARGQRTRRWAAGPLFALMNAGATGLASHSGARAPVPRPNQPTTRCGPRRAWGTGAAADSHDGGVSGPDQGPLDPRGPIPKHSIAGWQRATGSPPSPGRPHGRHRRHGETFRHDADHRRRTPVEQDRAPDDRRVRVEASRPEPGSPAPGPAPD